MKIAIAQINPRVGDVEWNLSLILEEIKRARKASCELVVFPELATLGYSPRDLLLYDHIVKANSMALEKMGQASIGLGVVCGYIEKK